MKKNKIIILVIVACVIVILIGFLIELSFRGKKEVNDNNYNDIQNKDTENVTSTNSETSTAQKNEKLVLKAKPGDFIEYYAKDDSESSLWQVLYNDDIDGLQIISYKIATEHTLGGKTLEEAKKSYNNAVDELNSVCEQFVNPKYAYSGRCVGSDPLSPEDKTTETFKFPNFIKNPETGCKIKDENYIADLQAMKSVIYYDNIDYYNDRTYTTADIPHHGMEYIGQEYWLASRSHTSYQTQYSRYDFSMYVFHRWLDTRSLLYRHLSGDELSTGGYQTYGVRPVITLKDELEISSGDGTFFNPYKLVAIP